MGYITYDLDTGFIDRGKQFHEDKIEETDKELKKIRNDIDYMDKNYYVHQPILEFASSFQNDMQELMNSDEYKNIENGNAEKEDIAKFLNKMTEFFYDKMNGLMEALIKANEKGLDYAAAYATHKGELAQDMMHRYIRDLYDDIKAQDEEYIKKLKELEKYVRELEASVPTKADVNRILYKR